MEIEPVMNRTLPAVAGAPAEARRAVRTFARAAGLDEDTVEAACLVASEAVSNAVLHAYEAEPGQVRLTAAIAGGELWLVVADDGTGFRAGRESPGLGVGLALIAQLSDDLAIEPGANGGTQLKMRFAAVERPRWADLHTRGGLIGRQPLGSVSSAISPASPSFSTTT